MGGGNTTESYKTTDPVAEVHSELFFFLTKSHRMGSGQQLTKAARFVLCRHGRNPEPKPQGGELLNCALLM